MSKVSKNQRQVKKVDAPLVKAVRTHYGFNDSCWMAVTATDEQDAERQIRADLGLKKGATLTIKTILTTVA